MRLLLLGSVLVLAGCAGLGWWMDRVDRIDTELRVARAEASDPVTAPERRAELEDRIETLEEERREALQGTQTAQENKQAILMAVITGGAQLLKIFGGMAAKGAGI